MEKKNCLEKIPMRNESINWTVGEEGIVTLEIKNKGIFNRLAQKFLKKPTITYVHLDKTGSFIWPLIDGKMDITTLAEKVDEHFGEEAQPLYERLVKYLQILESYHFIKLD